jgi:toxin YhaV
VAGARNRSGAPDERREPPARNGWKLYQWRGFGRLFANLIREVEQLERADPRGFQSHRSTKRLAAIYRLITDIIPANPNSPEFRQGNTLGRENRHWFSAGFHERYRLFFRFRSDIRVIDDTLRARGARSDAYAVFQRMLESGAPPGDWDELLAQSERLELPGE